MPTIGQTFIHLELVTPYKKDQKKCWNSTKKCLVVPREILESLANKILGEAHEKAREASFQLSEN